MTTEGEWANICNRLLEEKKQLELQLSEAHRALAVIVGEAANEGEMVDVASRALEEFKLLDKGHDLALDALVKSRQELMESNRLNASMKKALEFIATMDERVEPITWHEGYAKMVEVAKDALAEKRNDEIPCGTLDATGTLRCERLKGHDGNHYGDNGLNSREWSWKENCLHAQKKLVANCATCGERLDE